MKRTMLRGQGVFLAAILAAAFAAPATASEDKSALSAGKLKLPKGPGSLEGVGENVDVNFQMGQM
ncbi:MAG: hypothetical protein IV100_02925, partial [Myxococcales bacterium]|nr:hypothetical protein [Myxococcales bacterium]